MNLKKITMKLLTVSLLAFAISPRNVYAAEKQSNIELASEVKNITFTIEFESGGTYAATLTSPKGDIYDYTVVDGDTMTCDVERASAGTWITAVSSDGNVGKYTITVKGKVQTTTTNINDSITVGKDIVGLEMHFKDNVFCTSWSDTAIGSVVVKVVNLDNSEVLAEETTEGTSVECSIPENVSNISASVVPSTSKNVAGAAQTFTFEVPAKPEPTIEYSVGKITNLATASVSVTTTGNYSFFIEDNGNKTYSSDFCEPGTYDINFDLTDEGENKIKLYLVDENNNMFSYNKTIIRDTVSPSLTMEKEYDHISVSDETITIIGTVTDYSSITVNGIEVEPSTDGYFEYDVKLHIGDNKITVSAKDNANNDTTYDLTITRVEKKKSPKWLYILIGGFIGVIIGVLSYFKKKKQKVEVPDNGTTEPTSEKKNNMEELKTDKVLVKTSRFRKKEKESSEVNKKSDKRIDYLYWASCHKNKLITIGAFLLVVIFIFGVAFDFNYTSSGSMEPTLKIGNMEVGNKMAYISKKPQRGDVISFYSKELHEVMGKRVVGIAGDTIEFHDGYVYINGKLYDESEYLDEDVETNCLKTFTVPKGCVFVLGDNRENSKDSRFFKEPYIKISDIRDKYMFSIPLADIV